jgi:hypothetical protein
MRFNVLLAALAATIVATPALAAPAVTDDAPATARGVVLQQHSLINNGDLDFGIVTTDGTNAGTVSVDATIAGTRTPTGGVTLLPGASQAAKFDGLAAPLENVVLTLTPPVLGVLTDAAGDSISVNSMTVDSNGLNRTADSTGKFTVFVGGTFGLAATQPAGVYTAQFHLTAEYQ